jgi:hypothetical protein
MRWHPTFQWLSSNPNIEAKSSATPQITERDSSNGWLAILTLPYPYPSAFDAAQYKAWSRSGLIATFPYFVLLIRCLGQHFLFHFFDFPSKVGEEFDYASSVVKWKMDDSASPASATVPQSAAKKVKKVVAKEKKKQSEKRRSQGRRT